MFFQLLANGIPLGLPEILVIAVVLAMFAFWVWMIVDCATKEQPDSKIVWLLIVLLAGIVGAVIYFFVRKLPRGN